MKIQKLTKVRGLFVDFVYWILETWFVPLGSLAFWVGVPIGTIWAFWAVVSKTLNH
jgi:hypothetical protein